MFDALRRSFSEHQSRRTADAVARCGRIIEGCTNPARRAVLVNAASLCPDPVRQARLLADLNDAFNYGA